MIFDVCLAAGQVPAGLGLGICAHTHSLDNARITTMARIGYTTGVFDLFHIGHLNILRNAKLECDFLIAGVTTDELCESQKGIRPVIPFAERMAIVGAVKYVDMVVPQTTYDKTEALNNLKFNVVFVGDDWKGTERWKNLEKEFAQKGVSVHYFPYTQHTSSTKLREILDTLARSSR